MPKVELSPSALRELRKAMAVRKSFMWGAEGDGQTIVAPIVMPKAVQINLNNKTVTAYVGWTLGPLLGVIYAASKAGEEENQPFIHAFDEPLPILASDNSGHQLYIVGGGYTVRPEGITH